MFKEVNTKTVVVVKTGIIELVEEIIKIIEEDIEEGITIVIIMTAAINNQRIPTIPLVIVDGLSVSQEGTTINTTIDHKMFLEAVQEQIMEENGKMKRNMQMWIIHNWALAMNAKNKNCSVQQILVSISTNMKTYPWKQRANR